MMGNHIPGKTVFILKWGWGGGGGGGGGVSVQRCHFTSIGIPVFKIRWSRDCLIFNMGILIPGKTVFVLRQGPGGCRTVSKDWNMASNWSVWFTLVRLVGQYEYRMRDYYCGKGFWVSCSVLWTVMTKGNSHCFQISLTVPCPVSCLDI